MNDDLVAKRFGYYCGEELGGSEGEGQTPAMLAWDIFSDTDRFLASNGCSIGGYCTLTSPRTTHGEHPIHSPPPHTGPPTVSIPLTPSTTPSTHPGPPTVSPHPTHTPSRKHT